MNTDFTKFSSYKIKSIPCLDIDEKSIDGIAELIPTSISLVNIEYKKIYDPETKLEFNFTKNQKEEEIQVSKDKKFYYFGESKIGKVDERIRYKFYFSSLISHPNCNRFFIPQEKSPYVIIMGQNT